MDRRTGSRLGPGAILATLATANPHTLLAKERVRKAWVLPPLAVPSRLKSVRDRTYYLRRQRLRAQLPQLDKIKAAKMHTTFKNNLCLDALQHGYHKSFAQIFNLMKFQQLQRLRAGPESMLWIKVMLDDEPEKLMVMKARLTQGEEAMLNGDYITVYHNYFELAKYFQVTSELDKWLSDYFFDMALDTTRFIKSDDNRPAAEANCNVGLALKESHQFFDAAKYFERFHAHSRDKPNWTMDDGKTLQTEACSQLSLIYTLIANKFEASGEREKTRDYLQLAYDKANEGGDIRPKGLASFVLGLAYEKNRESEEAIKYLSVYRDTCKVMGDLTGLSIAYQCMATSFHTLGEMQESIEHLKLAVKVAEEGNDETELSKACSSLGAMYNVLGEYHQAVGYFTKAYNLSRALNHEETIVIARVSYGITTGHDMYEVYKAHIASEVSNRPAAQRLFDWKDSRDEQLLNPDKIQICFSAEAISSEQVRTQVQRFMERTGGHDVDVMDEDEDEPPRVMKAFIQMVIAGRRFQIGDRSKKEAEAEAAKHELDKVLFTVPSKTDVAKKVPPKMDVVKKVLPKTDLAKNVPSRTDVAKNVPSKTDVAKKVPSKTDVLKKVPSITDVAWRVPSKTDLAKRK